MKISILMPVYNEFRTFDEVLARVRRAPLPAGCSKEIVVVDDGSVDGTTQRVSEYGRVGLIVGHCAEKNAGKGAALRTGIALASGEIIIIQDGDLEYDPNDFEEMLQPIVRGHCDVVYGSRFLGRITGMKWRYRIANWILTRTANILYGARITDEATAYKALPTGIARQLNLESRGFEFCSELTAKLCRQGYRISEVPVSYNARGIAEGKKIRFRDGVIALWTLVKFRFLPAGPEALPSRAMGDQG